MSSVSNEQLFSAVLSSEILVPYLANDPELGILLETPNHCNIHYPRFYTSSNQITPALKQMLSYMLSKNMYSNLEATKQLLRFGEKHPESFLYDVTFNCEKQSYGVCCGLAEDLLQVICVLTGAHIPDELFGEVML